MQKLLNIIMGSLVSKRRRRSSAAENGKERKDSATVSNGFAVNDEESTAQPQLPAPAPATVMPGLVICIVRIRFVSIS